jgi:uncharacterized protein
MLTIKASVKQSKVEGIGLFADEKIPKGTITWKFNPRFDLVFSEAEVEKMSQQQKDFLDKYAFMSIRQGKWVLPSDDSRFTNHSINNNIDTVDLPGEIETAGMANRDIEVGDEILVNYRTFDSFDEKSDEDYLNT